ncbi:MAG: hypothetical protein V4650_09630 [Pseudomonadota bacterium]
MPTKSLLLALLLIGNLLGGTALALPLLGNPLPGGRPPAGDGFVPRGSVQAPVDQPERPTQGLSAQEAARQAQAMNGGGRVLSVDEARSGWRVKLLKDGNVRFVFVPN